MKTKQGIIEKLNAAPDVLVVNKKNKKLKKVIGSDLHLVATFTPPDTIDWKNSVPQDCRNYCLELIRGSRE